MRGWGDKGRTRAAQAALPTCRAAGGRERRRAAAAGATNGGAWRQPARCGSQCTRRGGTAAGPHARAHAPHTPSPPAAPRPADDAQQGASPRWREVGPPNWANRRQCSTVRRRRQNTPGIRRQLRTSTYCTRRIVQVSAKEETEHGRGTARVRWRVTAAGRRRPAPPRPARSHHLDTRVGGPVRHSAAAEGVG